METIDKIISEEINRYLTANIVAEGYAKTGSDVLLLFLLFYKINFS